MRESLWLRKVVQPLLELLRQGLTPEKIAFTIALGITLGVTPVLGSTALLCTLAAVAFRLNLPAIQLVNWLVYPLQLALLVPLLRIGAWMFCLTVSPENKAPCWNSTPQRWPTRRRSAAVSPSSARRRSARCASGWPGRSGVPACRS